MFVAVDPPGLAAIFLALTIHMTPVDRKATAYRACFIAFMILLLVAAGGRVVLDSLGIGFPAFRIAGGLLLFYIGFEMVFERREQRKNHSAESAVAHDHPHNIAAFPLAIPLMAGPGAITATILQAAASGQLDELPGADWHSCGGRSVLPCGFFAGDAHRAGSGHYRQGRHVAPAGAVAGGTRRAVGRRRDHVIFGRKVKYL